MAGRRKAIWVSLGFAWLVATGVIAYRQMRVTAPKFSQPSIARLVLTNEAVAAFSNSVGFFRGFGGDTHNQVEFQGPLAAVAQSAGKIIFAGRGDSLIRAASSSGKKKWEYRTKNNSVVEFLAASAPHALVVERSMESAAATLLDLEAGHVLWSRQIPCKTGAQASLASAIFVFCDDIMYVYGYTSGELVRTVASTKLLSQFPVPYAVTDRMNGLDRDLSTTNLVSDKVISLPADATAMVASAERIAYATPNAQSLLISVNENDQVTSHMLPATMGLEKLLLPIFAKQVFAVLSTEKGSVKECGFYELRAQSAKRLFDVDCAAQVSLAEAGRLVAAKISTQLEDSLAMLSSGVAVVGRIVTGEQNVARINDVSQNQSILGLATDYGIVLLGEEGVVFADDRRATFRPLMLPSTASSSEVPRSVIAATNDSEQAAGVIANSATESANEGSTKPRSLQIVSQPEKAVVFLDGEMRGETPTKFKVTPGQHRLAIFLDGYKPSIQDFAGITDHTVTLEKASRGRGPAKIKVRCREKNRYYVYLDDQPSGHFCPTPSLRTTVGKHTIKVYDAMEESETSYEVTVKDTGRSTRLNIR